jgi:hypothetical protein
MHTKISALVVAAGLGIAAQQAAAVVTFAFDDNPGPNGQFSYTAPANFGELGFLTYDSEVSVDLAVDTTGEGGTEFEYTDAIFTFSASVGTVFDGPFPGIFLAPLIGGSMGFFTSGGDALLSGSFGENGAVGFLVIVVNTGSINVSLEVGGLDFNPAPQLLADLSANIGTGVVDFGPPFDAVWTLTNMPQLTTIAFQNPAGGPAAVYIDDFQANSSFSGTTGIIVPTPASAALAGLGLACVAIRRKR